MKGGNPLKPPLRKVTDGEPINLNGATPPGVLLTATGLEITRELKFSEWDHIGLILCDARAAIEWAIGDWLEWGQQRYGEKYREGQAVTKYRLQSLKNIAWVARKFDKSVRRSDVKFTHYAYAAAVKEAELAVKLIDEAHENNWPVAKTLARVRAMRTEERFGLARARALRSSTYTVILADPSWKYEDGAVPPDDAPESRHRTMSLEQLVALPVSDIAARDAVLFLWSPSPKLPEALSLASSWGFTFRTSAVWVKDGAPGLGHYVRQRHEHLIIAKRGEMPCPRESDRPDSVFVAPRGLHSEKPECVFRLIEQMYPDQRYIELFARRSRPGWDGWGDQYPVEEAS